MKRSRQKSGRWQDHYTRQAKKEKYPARSVYKLKEIQKQYRIIKKGDRVLDLGCAPGSWLQLAAELTGSSGTVIGVDLKPVTIRLPEQVQTCTADILAESPQRPEWLETPFDVVISDMAPSTTGQRDVDAARSYQLCQAALAIAIEGLRAGGHFVCKIFQGPDVRDFTDAVKACFKIQKAFKPRSTRKASKEIFIIGIEKR
jgi:23S rRNA (uridine2552-2'-O)-methyltransferase